MAAVKLLLCRSRLPAPASPLTSNLEQSTTNLKLTCRLADPPADTVQREASLQILKFDVTLASSDLDLPDALGRFRHLQARGQGSQQDRGGLLLRVGGVVLPPVEVSWSLVTSEGRRERELDVLLSRGEEARNGLPQEGVWALP